MPTDRTPPRAAPTHGDWYAQVRQRAREQARSTPFDKSAIEAFATQQADLAPEEIARLLLRGRSPAELRALAIAHIATTVAAQRRAVAGQKAWREQQAARQEADFARYRDDPLANSVTMCNRPTRDAFRRWMGAGFDAWHRAAHRRVVASQDAEQLYRFESDWYPDGPMAYDAKRRAEDLARVLVALRENDDAR